MRVACVLILYNPNKDVVKQCIKSILNQIDNLVIVDNSSVASVDMKELGVNEKCFYLPLYRNLGIAAAQNEAISVLKECNPNYILFIDQDSISPDGMVEDLVNQACELRRKSIVIGGIGPMAINKQDFKKYVNSIKKRHEFSNYLIEVVELMNSGSLIPFENFERVGEMDSTLFIDGVDHEWCWRAKKKIGARFFISENICLNHQLGEGDHKFLGIRIPIPTPFRVYYQFRNYLILIRREYVPIYWKVSNGMKYLIKFFYYPLFISPRMKYLTNILRGIRDGVFVMKGTN